MTKLLGNNLPVENKIGEVTQGIGFEQLPVDSSESGTFSYAAYRSEVNQVPAADNVPENVLYEVEVVQNDLFTMNPDGSFCFNFNGQATGLLSTTVARTGGGGQEKIWFFAEIETSPGVWDTIGTSVVRGTQANQTDTTQFPLNVPMVANGQCFRLRMESQDASEGIGLYAEPATAEHPLVASTVLSFNMYPVS